jgi:hypothetical protein
MGFAGFTQGSCAHLHLAVLLHSSCCNNNNSNCCSAQAPTILADNEGSPFHELGLKEVMDGVSNRRAGMQTELAAVGR